MQTAAPPGPADAMSGGDTIANSAAAVWDAEAGVWLGDRAAGQEGSVPSPLWIFGWVSACTYGLPVQGAEPEFVCVSMRAGKVQASPCIAVSHPPCCSS